jgi:hypothetical protein
MAAAKIRKLKGQLNAKTQKATCKSHWFQGQHNFLMSSEAKAQIMEQLKEKERKRADQDASKKKKDIADQENGNWRAIMACDPEVCFRSMPEKKDHLVDLAFLLNVDTTGTIKDLTLHIKQHLHTTPARAGDPRFAHLYTSLQVQHIDTEYMREDTSQAINVNNLSVPIHSSETADTCIPSMLAWIPPNTGPSYASPSNHLLLTSIINLPQGNNNS